MASRVMPALLTRTSTDPDSDLMRSTTAFTAAELVTSTATPVTDDPFSSADRSASFTSRAHTRFAPSRTKVSTTPFPIPRAPPVTTHTFPSRRMTSPITEGPPRDHRCRPDKPKARAHKHHRGAVAHLARRPAPAPGRAPGRSAQGGRSLPGRSCSRARARAP